MGGKQAALREAAPILISSLWAAWVAGAAMAALNGIAEELQGGSVWGWGGLYRLQIWHVLAWTLFGLVWGALNILRRIRHRTKAAFGAWLGFPIYLAIWLFVIGYANLYWLPVIRSLESLAASALLVLAAAFLYRMGDKALGIRVKRPHLAWLTVALALVGVASFIGETGLRHSLLSMHPLPVITLTSRPPNVLLVVLDAVRPDHLGCYGYARPTSPRLDRFAAGSIIFEDAFAPSAYTQESAPALFTSAYPSTHGMFNFTDRLPTDFPLLPETLHRHGYRTGIFSTIRNVSAVFGYDRGMDDIFGVAVDPMEGSLLSQYLLRLSERRLPLISGICRGLLRLSRKLFACRDRVGTEDPRIITEQVVEWIGEDTDRPFFAYIHYRGGHHDYIPPAPYDRLFDPSYPGKPVISYPQGQPSFPPFVYSRPLSGPARTNMIAQYDGEIRLHDEAWAGFLKRWSRWKLRSAPLLSLRPYMERSSSNTAAGGMGSHCMMN